MKSSFSMGRGLGLLLAGALVLGCTDNDSKKAETSAANFEETVPAGEPEFVPGSPLVARYWAEADPKNGRFDLYEIKTGNKINRAERVTNDLRYTYSGTATKDTCTPGSSCVPAASSVRVWTDQTKVTYHDLSSGGLCRQNNGSYPATGCPYFPAGSTTCATPGVFCAPLQMVNNYSFALPNVVVRLRNPSDGMAPIVQCLEHGLNTSFGRCSDTQPAKLTPSTSNLTEVLPGCAYCYGNATNIDNTGGIPGLKNVVMPTSTFNLAHATINTDHIAMQLTSDANAQLVIEVRYAAPSFNTSGELVLRDFTSGDCRTGASTAAACVTPGTTCAIVTGGSFGPPSPCFTGNPAVPAACPSSIGATTTAHTGYTLQFPNGSGGYATATDMWWTDTAVRGKVPAGMSVIAGSPRVATPGGNASTPTTYTLCASTNSWRRLSNGLPAGRIDPVGGLVGSGAGARIVVAGGRVTGDGTSDTGLTTTYLLPVPASSSDNPSWTTGNAMVAGRWGAAYAVHNSDLYAFGGASNGNCLTSGERFDDGTLTWTATAAMPAAVCQARAVVSGQYIIVSGGMTVPWTSTNDFDLLPNTDTYVYDTAGNSWATYSAGGQVDPNQRFAAAATPSGGIIIGGGDFTDGSGTNAVSSASGGAPPAISNVAVSGLTARASAAVGYITTGTDRYFLFGGIIGTADANTAATNQLWEATTAAPGTWAQTTMVGGISPAARSGHVFISATGGDATERVYAIGGHSAGSTVTFVDEYTPAP